MSRERARRREQRLAEGRARRAAAERRERRRVALRRAVDPRVWWPRRRTGRLFPRRSRAQRAAIIGTGVVALGLTWYFLGSLPARIALTALILLAMPALTVLTFDRRT